ncbi:MAG: LysR family transcriptional regulator [Pseudomonadota bacterium]
MDKLFAMRAFVEIADQGSITAAAQALDRSQPSMVRTLGALEAHLGTRLLQRTTRRMSLTPEGRDYLARCRRILADVEDAEAAIGPQEGDPRGELRLSAPLEFGTHHVTPAVLRFLERFPAMRVELALADRNVDLVEEHIDLAVRIGDLADSTMVAIAVGTMRQVVVASPDLLAKVGTPRQPQALGELPCVRLSNLPHQRSTWRFGVGQDERQVKVDGPFACNQIKAAVTACRAGSGFGRFLYYQVHDHVVNADLVEVLTEHEVAPSPVSLVYPSARLVPARLRRLIDWLRDDLARVPAMG